MNQTDRIGQLLQKLVAGTHRDVCQCFPSGCLALLDQVSSEMPGTPAESELQKHCEVEPLGTGVDTHTHTRGRRRRTCDFSQQAVAIFGIVSL